ncbi:hypothetical protein T02_8542 [Trichinella nativa]|uniref:Uncharacterized protein n=1 Tax=Trichinella nativa TaxID=6335 RepID=A0A0V1LR68_9BILA|nr:hypothetical protein T02_8542 [Trichinella nativa]
MFLTFLCLNRTWLSAQDFGLSKFPVVNYANKHMYYRQRELAKKITVKKRIPGPYFQITV